MSTTSVKPGKVRRLFARIAGTNTNEKWKRTRNRDTISTALSPGVPKENHRGRIETIPKKHTRVARRVQFIAEGWKNGRIQWVQIMESVERFTLD